MSDSNEISKKKKILKNILWLIGAVALAVAAFFLAYGVVTYFTV